MTVLLGDRRGVVAADMDEITERAMNNEIEYAESLRKRAALLEGLPGPRPTRPSMRSSSARGRRPHRGTECGWRHNCYSHGGFERGVAAALEREGVSVDHIVSNWLPMEGDELTGTVDGPLIEGTKDDAPLRPSPTTSASTSQKPSRWATVPTTCRCSRSPDWRSG